MEVTVESRAPEEREADLVVLPLPEVDRERPALPSRWSALDEALEGRVAAVLASGDFRGRRAESLLLYGDPEEGPRRVLLVGLGPEPKADADALREAAAVAVTAALPREVETLELLAPPLRQPRPAGAAQALAEGLVLGAYRFDRYQSERGPQPPARATLRVEKGADLRAARRAARDGVVLAESQNLARDLSNEPPNALAPADVAREARRMAKETGLRVRVLEPAELRRRGFGAMMAVAQGSANPPRLIVLEHNAPGRGKGTRARRRTVCLVGKGVTFDSGGLSLKPSASMATMKHDMSGAAAVIGAMRAVALLKLPLHVVGVVGAVENMPSGTAYRPDDILKSLSGRTIEVTNTDAEGRLVLADALHFARTEYEPEAMIDLATLTGACVIALGSWSAAVLGNHDRLARLVMEAGEATGERYWQLPLWDAHREFMKSQIADVKQTGGREAGTITAAAFLSHFVGETPWAHLDIAPVANTDTPRPGQPRGATGFGVRSLVELLRSLRRARLD
ncbi:MAG: leucyl aminopeptidase [Myxococcota bacterium]|nr:leucyl aminopeptidase [Myxococcota bacterium]